MGVINVDLDALTEPNPFPRVSVYRYIPLELAEGAMIVKGAPVYVRTADGEDVKIGRVFGKLEHDGEIILEFQDVEGIGDPEEFRFETRGGHGSPEGCAWLSKVIITRFCA